MASEFETPERQKLTTLYNSTHQTINKVLEAEDLADTLQQQLSLIMNQLGGLKHQIQELIDKEASNGK